MLLGFLIVAACVAGGLTLGICFLVAGLILRSGLPGSPQRRVQQAKVARDIATFNAEAEKKRLETARYLGERDLVDFKVRMEMSRLQAAEFQRELEAPPKEA